MRGAVYFAMAASLAGASAAACPITIDFDRARQGALMVWRAEANAIITIGDRKLRLDPDTGVFAFGIDRDAPETARLEVVCADGAREAHEFSVAAREYEIERIEGLPPQQVTPPPELLARIRRDGALIRAARARDVAGALFVGGFIWPVVGRISGNYGNQRILNGEPRSPHLGVDIAAPTGTAVKAAAAGEVSLAEDDLFYTGGTITIDHGHAVSTIYSHLEDVHVAVGDVVTQGQVIGTVGATGRATGPHLDWRLNWFQMLVDPLLAAGPMPAP